MFHVERKGDDRLDITFGGKLDSEAMRAALDELIAQSEGIEHGRMLYRVEDFHLPTLGAIGIEMARLPGLFRFIGRFDRAAVIAGQDWIRRASELEGWLIPGLTIKAFGPDEGEKAEAWLQEAT